MRSCRLAAIATISFMILFYTAIYCIEVIFHWSILRSDSAKAFLLAHDLWMRRPFTRYKLVVEQEGYSVKQCRQEFEVFNEKIIAVTENTCVSDSWHEVRLSIEFCIDTNGYIFFANPYKNLEPYFVDMFS